MKPSFHYVEICDDTIRRLVELLEAGDSVAVVGPRGVGKRHLAELINRQAARTGAQPAAVATFSADRLLVREADVVRELSLRGGLEPAEPTIKAWAEAVRGAASVGQPLRLFITRIDGMSKRLAHQLLSAIGSLVGTRHLVALVTGEGSIIDLVDGGPASPWPCPDVFVVHCHGRREFYSFLNRCMRQMSLRFPRGLTRAKHLSTRLYAMTGGNISLLRTMLWSVSDTLSLRTAAPSRRPREIDAGDLTDHLTNIRAVPTVGLIPFQHALECILAAAREPADPPPEPGSPGKPATSVPALDDLCRLLDGEDVRVGERPHITELTGLTRRGGGLLQWSCPYARTFAENHFTPQRLGDCYAFAQEWGQAHAQYERSTPEAKFRPLSDEDVPVFMRLMDGLAAHFHRLISDSINDRQRRSPKNPLKVLRAELRKALRHLLGFEPEQVSGWSLDWQGRWQCVAPGCEEAVALPEPVRMAWEALRVQDRLCDDEVAGCHDGYHWVICRDAERRAIDAVLLDARNDPLGDYPARRAAVSRIFRGYRRARERWAMTEGLRERLAFSKTESKILETFWKLTGVNAWGAERMLPQIAHPVLECFPAIKRLVFCDLVSTAGDLATVRPVFDSARTAGSVFDTVNIEQETIERATGSAVVFSKAQGNERWAATKIAPFEHEGFLVVDPYSKGLLLVEGAPDRPITAGVVACIRELADTVRPVWNQAQRLRLLHESINALSNPAVILDRRRRILYANRPAGESLGLPVHGWQENPLPISELRGNPRLCNALTPDLNAMCAELRDVTAQMAGVWLRECYPLREDSTRIAGWALTFRNRAFLYDSFDLISALERAVDERDCLRIIADRIRTLLRVPDIKLRIYGIDKSDSHRLVGFRSVGLEDEEHTRIFESGEFAFPDTDAEAWECLRDRCPRAFKLVDPSREKRGEKGQTKRGLQYQHIHPSSVAEILEKKPGDVSIDFPLISGKEILGKLTVNFSAEQADELSPGIPLQMGALSFVLGDVLDHASRAEIKRRQMLIEHADQALAETAHNLSSEISGFAAHIFHYQLLEPQLPALRAINDRFEIFYDHALESMKRIKERAGAVVLRLEKADFAQAVERALSIVLSDQADWSIRQSGPVTEAYWDAHHWEYVFVELAHNSRDFVRPGVPLRVTVELRWRVGEGENPPEVDIVYSDNGRGVPDELKAFIFEGKSYRQALGKRGNGLGLSYARKVVEAHGGCIRETGTFGSGATFTITAPIKTTMPPAAPRHE